MMTLNFDGSGATGQLEDLESLFVEHAPHVSPEFADALLECLHSPDIVHLDQEVAPGASEILLSFLLPQCLHDAIATLRACDGERGGHHSCHDLLNRVESYLITPLLPGISYNTHG